MKWVIAGNAPAFAGIYNGRFAPKWTGNYVNNFLLNDFACDSTNVYAAGNNDNAAIYPLSFMTITNFIARSTSWSNCTILPVIVWKNVSARCIEQITDEQVTSTGIKIIAGAQNKSTLTSPAYILTNEGAPVNWKSIAAGNETINSIAVTKNSGNNPSNPQTSCTAVTDTGYYCFTSLNLSSGSLTLPTKSTWPSPVSNVKGISCLNIGPGALNYWVAVGINIACSQGGRAGSYDAVTYSGISQMNAVANYSNLATGSIYWVVVGNNTSGITISYTKAIIGSSGWTSVANSNVFFTNGTAVTCNTNMWVASGTKNAGGYLHFAFSYDGGNWFSLGNFNKTFISCKSIKYLSNLNSFVVTGAPASGSTTGASGSTNYTVGDMSTNAIAWSRAGNALSANLSVACNPNATAGQAKWVVAGSNVNVGAIMHSINGINWLSTVTFTYTTAFNSVIYGNVMWVAVGTCDTSSSSTSFSIVYSFNGIVWTGVTNSSYISINFKSVTWTGYMFIAVTSDTLSKYAYSYDGTYWFAAGVNNNITASFIGTGYGSEPIVVGIGSGSTNNYTFGTYTTQQSSWSNFFKDANTYNCVACNNGVPTGDTANVRWVIVGDASSNYSLQGITFDNILNFAAKAVACNNSINTTSVNWVAVGPNGIYWSIDGKSFTQVPGSTALSNNFSTIVWNGKTWVAGATGSGCSFAYSYDGKQWFHSGISSFFLSGTISFATDEANNVVTGSSASPVISYGTPATNNITWYSPFTDLSNCEIRGVACNNNIANNVNTVKWVAVGNVRNSTTNKIIYSYDGLTWTSTTAPLTNLSTTYAVACNPVAAVGNAKWVAVGSGTNSIAYSLNGQSPWSSVTDSTGANIGTCYGVCYNNSKFIAISNSGYATSSDGITWSYFINGSFQIFDLSNNSIAFGNDICVAVGKDTTNKNTAVTIDDTTISWVNCSNNDLFNNIFYGVACNNGQLGNTVWVAVGSKIVTSTDGSNWSDASLNSTILTTGYGVAYNPDATGSNAKWVAVGTGANSIVYSTDPSGNSWTSVANSATNFFTTGRAVAWTGTWWVATGDGGTIAFSTNGIDWANFNYNLISGLAVNASNYIRSIKWAGFYWVATGLKNTTSNGCLLYSVDGKYWSETLDSKFLTYIDSLNTIGWTSNISNVNIKHPIVAVGTYAVGKTAIAYSIDGYKWINVGAGIFTTGNAVAWNGTMWVAVGEGANAIAYSYDGLSWVGIRTSLFSNGKCIAWNGYMWLAGGSDGTLAYSYDGINWAAISQIFLTSCNAIAWNGTMWCVGGASSNPIITSFYGFTWTQQTNNFTSCKDIKSNGQMWVAVGSATTSATTSANAIQYSYDGINWYSATELNTTTTNINAVAWNGKRWVADSPSTPNALAYSDDGISWTSNGNGVISTSAIAWTGDKWIAGGLDLSSSCVFKTSFNGITWNNVSQTVLAAINGIAGNPRIGATVLDSQLLLSSNGPGLDNTLDIVSGPYYQSGYTNVETTITSETQANVTFQDYSQMIEPQPKGITWVALSTGTNNVVYAISAVDNSNVYVSGLFTKASGTGASFIARWDGATWSALSTGTNSNVYTITAVDNSNVYVGGEFTDIGGDTNKIGIAKWDGTTWNAIGSGTNGSVYVISAYDNSNVYVGGDFTDIGGDTNKKYIARWDGATWRAVSSGTSNSVTAISALDNSNVYVGGDFTNIGGDTNKRKIMKFDGTTWQRMGSGIFSGHVNTISAKDNSNVYVGGSFTSIGGDFTKSGIAKWAGSTWARMGAGISNTVFTISAKDNSNVYVGGQFINIGSDTNKKYIARWDGSTWQSVSSGTNNFVQAISAYDNSNVYIGGDFSDIGGDTNKSYIAKWSNVY